jgi:hypothetical protein
VAAKAEVATAGEAAAKAAAKAEVAAAGAAAAATAASGIVTQACTAFVHQVTRWLSTVPTYITISSAVWSERRYT